MTPLSDLIAKLEAAKEGSRELDALIAVAIFETQKTDDDLIYARECAKSDNCAAGTYWHVQRSGIALRTAPLYTISFDAALTLVAQGNLVECELTHDWAWWAVEKREASHREPALALCIAALKAREARR